MRELQVDLTAISRTHLGPHLVTEANIPQYFLFLKPRKWCRGVVSIDCQLTESKTIRPKGLLVCL